MAATCRQIAHVWEINNSGMEWFETKLRPPIGTIASVVLPRVEGPLAFETAISLCPL